MRLSLRSEARRWDLVDYLDRPKCCLQLRNMGDARNLIQRQRRINRAEALLGTVFDRVCELSPSKSNVELQVQNISNLAKRTLG